MKAKPIATVEAKKKDKGDKGGAAPAGNMPAGKPAKMTVLKFAPGIMRPIQKQIKQLFADAIKGAFPDVKDQPEPVIQPSRPQFGDFQCNNAMGLFKAHGKAMGARSPKDVGELIMSCLPANDLLDNVNVAPQGFISMKLNSKWLAKLAKDTVLDVEGVDYKADTKRNVVVDFSSPNIAKEMHVGHLRSTIIGESTCRILEMVGHDVTRLNHTGDWGTQFGMLIEYMREAYPDYVNNMPDLSDLQGFYKAAKKRFEDENDTTNFKKRAQMRVVALQSGDKESLLAWKTICEISRVQFNIIYDKLGVTLEERGESYYNDLISPIITDLKAKGFVKESDGAQCFFPEGQEVPLILVKGDGGFGYDSTDTAAIHHRLVTSKADWVIYITDLGQETHFFKVFDLAKTVGWHTPPKTRLDHMGFGVVQGADGKRFRTSSGESVKLIDLLDEASRRAEVELKRRQGDADEKTGSALSEAEFKDAAEQIGYGAVRYFDLKQNRKTNYKFDYDQMLDPKGNTAVYLFYAYARILSIQRKSGKAMKDIPNSELTIGSNSERALILHLLKFPDTIETVMSDLNLHWLTEYCYDLCNILTTFYTENRVLGVPEENSRLLICEAARKVLLKCFNLLGLKPLDRI